MLCCFEETWISNSSLYHSLVLKQHRDWTFNIKTKTRPHLNYIEDIFSVDGSRKAIKLNHSHFSVDDLVTLREPGHQQAWYWRGLHDTFSCLHWNFFFFAISDIFVFQVIISCHCILVTDHIFFSFFFLTSVHRKHHEWHMSIYIYIIYQCQGCWWPGDWHHPDISRRSTDYNFLLVSGYSKERLGKMNDSISVQCLKCYILFYLFFYQVDRWVSARKT